MKVTAQIFLSYAREDEEKVENLYHKLSDVGFKPWMDKKDILPGERWESCIRRSIRRSDFFLVCLSANSIDKRGWIQKEIKQALDIWQEKLDSDIYLIPVRLEDCEVPESLRKFQWVNLFEEDGWTRLVKAIQVGMERRKTSAGEEARRQKEETRPLPIPAQPRRPVTWEGVGAIAGVIAVFIALGAWLVPNAADLLSAWLSKTPTVTPTSSPTHTPVISTATLVPSTDTPTLIPPTPTPVLLTDTLPPSSPLVMERVQPFEPEMILIPSGEFLMGSDPSVDKDASDDEQPQHTLYLPDYYMAKTPVTNAQYAAFVQATGHRQPGHWEGGKPPEGEEDHPVNYVSWHDAVAYCDWLAEVTGRPYRLPSEAEWEKGARGSDGRIYPWGNQWDAKRCNSYEGGKEDTTPVGAYPEGASPYGFLDMAGNVWEWTRSIYKEYPYDLADGREDLDAPGSAPRVLRGGAFYFNRWVIRCALRLRSSPYSRLRTVGFRVCVVSQRD